jgi:HEAT repeat protein
MTDDEKRSELLKSLREISPMPTDDLLTEELLTRHEDILNALAPIANEECIEPLIGSFGYGDAYEGYWPIVHLLETLPDNLVHKALRRALESGSDGARMWAAHMLARRRDVRDVGALVKASDDRCELVRANAVLALGVIGTSDAVEALRAKAQDPSAKVRGRVNDLLTKLTLP